MSEVTKSEFNGLGQRVSTVEVDMSAVKTKVIRTDDDIQKIFARLDTLPYWIISAVLVPIGISVYQILTK